MAARNHDRGLNAADRVDVGGVNRAVDDLLIFRVDVREFRDDLHRDVVVRRDARGDVKNRAQVRVSDRHASGRIGRSRSDLQDGKSLRHSQRRRLIVQRDCSRRRDHFCIAVLVQEREHRAHTVRVEEGGGGIESLGSIHHELGPTGGQRR